MAREAPETVTVVAALVETREEGSLGLGKLFLARRSLGGSSGGLWELPGGKVEVGEGVETALRREIREELGVGLADLGPALAYRIAAGERRFRFLVVPATFDSLRFALTAHDEYGWFEPAGLPWDELAPFDAEALRDWVAGKFG